ncbi:MAG: S53 family peptidase [Thermoproteus sp.]
MAKNLLIILALFATLAVAQPLYFNCNSAVPGVPQNAPAHLIVWLWLNNVTTPKGLNYLLYQQYYAPSSPYYHKFITPQQFAAWYSPPAYVFSYIKDVASSSGLTILGVYPMAVVASGTASAVDNAIVALQSAPSSVAQWIIVGECVPIGYFAANTRSSRAPAYKPAYVTAEVGNLSQALGNVTYVNGLPLQIRYRNFEIWLPKGLQFIYDELPLLLKGVDGRGVTIGIVDAFGDVNFTLAYMYQYKDVSSYDFALFNKLFGLPQAPLSVIYPVGMPVITPYNLYDALGWSYETALDIEYAHTMAPGANIVLAVAPDAGDDLFIAVEYLVNKSLADFISLSWGAPEDFYLAPPPTPQLLLAYDEVFMQAAAEGIGVFASSGDWGAFNIFWQYYGLPIEPSVLYPASDPWVTAVGGTSLHAYFSNGMVTRIEQAWSWNAYYMWGSGGGYSFVFPETPGQRIADIVYERPVVYEPALSALYGYKYFFYPAGHRGVPDVAADADPYTGVLIVINGSLFGLIGGTSLASPLVAGMTATVQSGIGFRIGLLAPALYALYSNQGNGTLNGPYVQRPVIPTSAFYSGFPEPFFPTYGGQNGLYNVLMQQWSPVTGIGQLNVYGIYSFMR